MLHASLHSFPIVFEKDTIVFDLSLFSRTIDVTCVLLPHILPPTVSHTLTHNTRVCRDYVRVRKRSHSSLGIVEAMKTVMRGTRGRWHRCLAGRKGTSTARRNSSEYAATLFRPWTPPHTTSLEEVTSRRSLSNVEQPSELTREESFGGDYGGSVRLMKRIVRSVSKKSLQRGGELSRQTSFATYAGERNQDARRNGWVSYAGELDREIAPPSGLSLPTDPTDVKWLRRIMKNRSAEVWSVLNATSTATNRENAASRFSSIPRHESDEDEDDWGTPRCTVP